MLYEQPTRNLTGYVAAELGCTGRGARRAGVLLRFDVVYVALNLLRS
jgi:hypothetical protein